MTNFVNLPQANASKEIRWRQVMLWCHWGSSMRTRKCAYQGWEKLIIRENVEYVLHGWFLNVNFGHSVQWSGDLIVDLDFYWQFSQNNATLMHLYMNFKVICEITFLIKKFALQKHSKNVLLAKLKRWILFLGQTSCDFIWFSNQKILLYHQNTK